MRLALIRHGQTDWNIQRRYQGWKGLGLNDVGRAQAVDAAARLVAAGSQAGAAWTWLASSTAERAVQTAQVIGAHAGLEPREQVWDLIERGFGVAEGMLIEEARTRWPARDYEGGETVEQVLTRALSGVNALAAAHDGADGVIVTHGTVLRLIVEHVTGEDPGSLPNGALAVLDGEPSAWSMLIHPLGSQVAASR